MLQRLNESSTTSGAVLSDDVGTLPACLADIVPEKAVCGPGDLLHVWS